MQCRSFWANCLSLLRAPYTIRTQTGAKDTRSADRRTTQNRFPFRFAPVESVISFVSRPRRSFCEFCSNYHCGITKIIVTIVITIMSKKRSTSGKVYAERTRKYGFFGGSAKGEARVGTVLRVCTRFGPRWTPIAVFPPPDGDRARKRSSGIFNSPCTQQQYRVWSERFFFFLFPPRTREARFNELCEINDSRSV